MKEYKGPLNSVKMTKLQAREAAKYFNIDRKTVFNHCTGKTKNPRGVRFQWITK